MEVFLLVLSFAVILAGALLFTNSIEWIGHKLNLGEGAVGSLLAAVGTALPETLIAIVALVGATQSEEVAIGAIVGAPFLLATLAMGLVGLTAYGYRRRRPQGIRLRAHVPTLDRDLAFFMVFFGLALALGFGAPESIRAPAGIVGVVSYFAYVFFTVRDAGPLQPEETLNPLIMMRGDSRAAEPPLWLAVIQCLVGLAAMVGGAHLFVEELLHVADDLGAEPIVLSLILAPLATELPEKVNSFFWVREGKDALALGNITGAMVFQSTIPVGIGLIFTDWELSGDAAVSVALGLAGGLLAYWALRLRDRFELAPVLGWLALYAAFIVVVRSGRDCRPLLVLAAGVLAVLALVGLLVALLEGRFGNRAARARVVVGLEALEELVPPLVVDRDLVRYPHPVGPLVGLHVEDLLVDRGRVVDHHQDLGLGVEVGPRLHDQLLELDHAILGVTVGAGVHVRDLIARGSPARSAGARSPSPRPAPLFPGACAVRCGRRPAVGPRRGGPRRGQRRPTRPPA